MLSVRGRDLPEISSFAFIVCGFMPKYSNAADGILIQSFCSVSAKFATISAVFSPVERSIAKVR